MLSTQISCFSWKLFHNRLPTSAWTRSIGFQLATCCTFCLGHDESGPDLFFLFPFTQQVWYWCFEMMNSTLPLCILHATVWNYLTSNVCKTSMKGLGAFFFFIVIYDVWRSRNRLFFENQPPTLKSICDKIQVDWRLSLGLLNKPFSSPKLTVVFAKPQLPMPSSSCHH